ncbi:TetR family transcriptional regulator [Brevibacillus ruminantium]|uniref:TetR family transcriptional regulator n=1 Tax=Brevibacillus ruminantium TaxID=2950604 RepID=A0ABY4WDI5_9BACL|nr:TetR family transcriptional regulator [Brevibacillus ruminantium]USG64814.1 TetR family transcriptional regulator [Brevibacillus ruminantium]
MAPRVSDAYKTRKKQELLQAARRIFVRKGYTRATMQDIMEEAGVSRGALYAYFENIEHVYLELLRSDDQTDIQLFLPDDSCTAWQQLKRWVYKQQTLIEGIEHSLLLANTEFFLSMHNQKPSEGSSYLHARYERIVEVLIEFFQQGVAKNELQPQQPVDSIAHYLVSFIDGLMLDSFHMGPHRTNVPAQIEVLLFSLQAMLSPTDENSPK